jgi:hypothetical protein
MSYPAVPRRDSDVPGFAIATLKVGAWATLVLGVVAALVISFLASQSSAAAVATGGASSDYVRIALELGCAFVGFVGWALLLVVATLADQVEQLNQRS